MKVISSPNITNWKEKCKCVTCSSELEITSEDVFHRIEQKYYGGRDIDDGFYSDYDYYYVKCMMCSKEISIRGDSMPYLLREQIKERCKQKKK